MTVMVGETDGRDSDELEAACILDLDGILHVSVMRSIRKDIEESGSEVGEEYVIWMIQITVPS